MRELVAPAEAIFLDAKFEAELVELDDEDEAREMLAEMGDRRARARRAGPGRLRHPRAADLPDRRAQGVARLDDPQGRHRPRGRRRHPHRLPAGFIKAEVVSFDDLVAAGSMAAAKSAGKVRMEGKDYVMADGDVVEFRFNV